MAHPPADALELLSEERVVLEEIASCPSLPHRSVREAEGLLLAAEGVANSVIAERLGASRSTVLGWRRDFIEHGVEWGRQGPARPWTQADHFSAANRGDGARHLAWSAA